MNEKQIKKRYDSLVAGIEQQRMYDGRGQGVDVYVCEKCGGLVLTRYKDKGVTPFTIRCRVCSQGTMVHKDTVSERHAEAICLCQGTKVKEWVRPTLDQLMKMNEGLQDHVLNGGLVLEEEVSK